ncbi:DsbA family protein [Corynebacterium pseudotuberculosis]|uniref:DsbA family protein n=1 Tax=Corynebacterium pseudotuberculosis TaxID=1719 RepID=UPI0001DD4807|nr:thioredoxin domain-containing protein [Corynebacterium pseudotuberculosis]ADK28059.1 thioredoxin domain-containing protein [Corynebacterium pseudotuberculosis FRC41]ADL20172.1 thioredoxin domain-containing protein [Corynebacterium pseudotuberculosis 1002]ADO25561.1 thioredoxin domain-containing protein [Corynebacterium pseudotuberculosis I19]AEX38743.1 Thiol:disulfide interchange protein DsbA [Corynebacterium pseudotuberculosis 3/99-5]AFH51190.1 Thiol:disulfide interchange protein DsbA [Cor
MFSIKRPAVLALLIVILLIVGIGAYTLGRGSAAKDGDTSANSAGSSQGAGPSLPPGFTGKTGSSRVSPGTKTDGPVALANGSYDAMIYGPGKELKSAEDILNVHRRNAKDPFALGALDAPVVISEFSDFECPFCAKWSNETEPTIIKEYVEKGFVRIEWNDLPINGPDAVSAAKAGRAAAAQGKFNEFRSALFQASKTIKGHPENKLTNFEEFAREAGVKDMARFSREASDATYDSVVDKAREYAGSLGINGTPGFVVGTQYVSGAQPTEVFIRAIEAELAKVADGKVAVPSV